MPLQELSARHELYRQVGAFFDGQMPEIIGGTTKRMNSGEMPLYFCRPLEPDKIYSIAYDTDSLSDLPEGTFFGEPGMSLLINFVSIEQRNPRYGGNTIRSVLMSMKQAGENFVRPYDVQHPLTSEAIEWDASHGRGAMYRLLLSPESSPTVVSHDHLPLPTNREKSQTTTGNPWETLKLLAEEGYEPYEINDDEALLVLGSLLHIGAAKNTEHLYSAELAQFYCEQMVYPGVPTVGMYMRPKE